MENEKIKEILVHGLTIFEIDRNQKRNSWTSHTKELFTDQEIHEVQRMVRNHFKDGKNFFDQQ